MAAGLVSHEGDVLGIERTPSPARESADDMWNALSTLCVRLLTEAGQPEISGIGVGCAGPMVWPDGIVSPLNITAWRGFPLRARLSDQWPDVPVRIHNDAIVMAAAEHWKGAAAGYDNALGMVVSTGVGGGLVIAGKLVDGGLGNAGHIGHIVVDPHGPACVCGGYGCLEPMSCGPATAAWAVEQGWVPRHGSRTPDAKTLAEDATAGDPVAKAAYERSGGAVGVALASAATLLDLDIAVIGGGLAQSGELLMAPIRKSFAKHACMAFAKRMRIVTAALDQTAGVVGAAALVAQGHRYWSPHDD